MGEAFENCGVVHSSRSSWFLSALQEGRSGKGYDSLFLELKALCEGVGEEVVDDSHRSEVRHRQEDEQRRQPPQSCEDDSRQEV